MHGKSRTCIIRVILSTHSNTMGKNPKALSHAEVWDDTALQKSWNDALAEYKLYHSIHARGERVEDVLREAEKNIEAETEVANEALIPLKTSGSSKGNTICPAQELEDGELEDGEMIDGVEEQTPHSIQAPSSSQAPVAHKPNETSHTTALSESVADAAHTLTSKVRDEGLKNLMMSWYYAGYYTGLHEGQQQSADKAA